MTAHAPASSARRACSAFTTSQITPPLSISGKVRFTCIVPVCFCMTDYLLDDWMYNVCTNILSHGEREPLQPIESVETSHIGHYSPGYLSPRQGSPKRQHYTSISRAM